MIPREVASGLIGELWNHAFARLVMIVMPIVFGATVYFGHEWLDGKFDKLEGKTVAISQRIDDVTQSLDKNTAGDMLIHDRMTISEQVLLAARDDRDRFQKQLVEQLTNMQKDIQRSSIDIAAISAYVSAVKNNDDRGNNGDRRQVPTGPFGPRGNLR